MQSLSHIVRRRLPGAVAASFALLVLGAGPAHAATIAPSKAGKLGKNMVSANNVQSVIDYLATKGATMTKGTTDAGGPMLTEADNLYDVYFYCNDDHTSCDAIQFRACYSDYAGADVNKANALNRDYFFAKSYIDKTGNVCLETPIATGPRGISYEALDLSFDAFIGFTESAGDDFGTGEAE
jgi:hypothetical protein